MDTNRARCTHCGRVLIIEKQAAYLHCPECGATLPSARLKRYYRTNPEQTTGYQNTQPSFRTEHTEFLILQGILERYSGNSRDLSLPGGIEVIGSKAFMGCYNLVNVAIPEGVTAIESEAFAHCPNLTTVILPRTLRRIGDSAFEACPLLQHIEIPEKVRSIGALAFAGCKQLSDVRLLGETKPFIGRNAFHMTPAAKKPSGSTDCFIATCVYGSATCPEVRMLRLWRDRCLAATSFGRAFISLYYAVSPHLIRMFGRQMWFHRLWRGFLNRKIAKLRASGKYQSSEI